MSDTQAVSCVERVAEELREGTEPHLLSGEQYLRSLADGRRVIASDGTPIANVAEHPETAAAARTFANVMDLQFDPRVRDKVTYVDDDGTRKALGWQVPTEREHLYAKYEQIGVTTRETLGMFGRPPDYGPAMSLGFLGIIDRFEQDDPESAENILRFVKMSGEHNLLSSDLIAEAQADRTLPRNERPATLRIVDETPEGIVLRGSRIAGSSGAITHFYTLSTVLGEGLTPDAAIWAALPVNTPGLTLVMREPMLPSEPRSREDHPIDRFGEEMDQIILFDDVFIPREMIFSKRNLETLKLYFESVVYVSWHIMTRLAFRAQIFAGTAQAIVDILGTANHQGVRRAVAEITSYAETLRAFSLAAISQSQTWNGIEVPDPGFVTVGRLHSINEYPRIIYTLRDLCGQGLISRWPKTIWEHPEFGPRLQEYLPGHGATAREKNRLFNFVWDLTSGANASRVGLFENVNATPPAFVTELVYRYVDRTEMANFVREFADVPNPS